MHPEAAREDRHHHRGRCRTRPRPPAPRPPAPAPIAPLLASADPAAGESLAKKLCVACHTFNEGGKAGVGPNLYGVVGGPHAHMEGFNYSDAMKAKQAGPWTFDELNEWLLQAVGLRARHPHGVRRHHER